MTEKYVVVQQAKETINIHEMLLAGTLLLQRIHHGTPIPDLLRESCTIAQTDQSLLTASDKFLLSCHTYAQKQILGTNKTPQMQEFYLKLFPETKAQIWEKTQSIIEEYTLRLVRLAGQPLN